METIFSAILSAVISSLISGIIVAWFKSSVEKTHKLSDENSRLKFDAVTNHVKSVENKIVGVHNEVIAVKGVQKLTRDAIQGLDKNMALMWQKQEHMNEKIEVFNPQNYGKVIRKP